MPLRPLSDGHTADTGRFSARSGETPTPMPGWRHAMRYGLAAVLALGLLAGTATERPAAGQDTTGPAAESMPTGDEPGGESSVVGTRTATTGGDGSALVSAGATVALDADTEEDAIVAGGAVRVDGRIAEDLFAAGGRVRVAAEVAEDAIVAGGRVEIAAPAVIGGTLTAIGGDIGIDGIVRGNARLAGGSIEIAGEIAGDVEAAGGSLTVLPGATVGGDIVWRGREAPTIAEGATVGGTVDHRAFDDAEIDIAPPRIPEGAGIAGTVVFLLGCVLAGALWLAATPRFLARASLELRARPGISALLGLGVAAAWPVAAVIAAVTVIGLPLALTAFLLYPVILFAGWLMAAFGLSEAVLDRRTFPAGYSLRLAGFGGALVVLAVLGAIPFLGGLILLAAVLLGLGGLVRGITGGRDPLAV